MRETNGRFNSCKQTADSQSFTRLARVKTSVCFTIDFIRSNLRSFLLMYPGCVCCHSHAASLHGVADLLQVGGEPAYGAVQHLNLLLTPLAAVKT